MQARSTQGRSHQRSKGPWFLVLRRFVREQRGAAAIEFAILLPVLCAILLGMIDYGYFFFLNSTIVNAAREGARAGVVITTDATDTEAEARAVARAYLTAANVRLDTGVNHATVEPVYDATTRMVEVTVEIDPYTPVTGFLPTGAMPARATHVSTMRHEGFIP